MLVMRTAAPTINDSAIAQTVAQRVWPSGASGSACGLKRAFQSQSDRPMHFMVSREIYKHLERITDAFEDVANEIDGIVIDHA